MCCHHRVHVESGPARRRLAVEQPAVIGREAFPNLEDARRVLRRRRCGGGRWCRGWRRGRGGRRRGCRGRCSSRLRVDNRGAFGAARQSDCDAYDCHDDGAAHVPLTCKRRSSCPVSSRVRQAARPSLEGRHQCRRRP
jgi:hypothetical protein